MGKLVKSNLNTHNAKQFVESLNESANSLYYVYLGKHTAFSDDNNPPTANNSEEDLVGNDPRMAIDAELAKLDHAWERRNINSEVEEEDPLNELNNEVENFDI